MAITDEATELANFFSRVLNFVQDPADILTYQGVCAFGMLDPNAPAALDAISEIRKRCARVKSLVKSIDGDDMMDDVVKQSVFSAIDTLSSAFNPINFPTQWRHLVRADVFGANINTLRLLGRTVRHYQPINKVSAGDIDSIKSKISEAYNEVLNSNNIGQWSQKVLIQGLEVLNFRIEHFDFFGHDATISSLAAIRLNADAISKSDPSERGSKPRLVALGLLLLAGSEIFIRPAEVSQAFDTYRSALHGLFVEQPPLLAPPQKRIEGPKTKDSAKGAESAEQVDT